LTHRFAPGYTNVGFPPYWQSRKAAVNKIKDQEVLAWIAKNDKEYSVSLKAIELINNQELFADIYRNAKNKFIRKEAKLRIKGKVKGRGLLGVLKTDITGVLTGIQTVGTMILIGFFGIAFIGGLIVGGIKWLSQINSGKIKYVPPFDIIVRLVAFGMILLGIGIVIVGIVSLFPDGKTKKTLRK